MILLFGIALAAPAASRGAGTSSAPFLREEPTARVTSMGGAAAALSDDAGAVYFNPAGLAFTSSHRLSFTTWKGLDDTSRFTFLSGIYDAGRLGVFDLSYLSYDSGSEDIFDLGGTQSSVKLAQDYALGLGWGHKLIGGLSAGAQLKYVKSKLAEAYTAKTATFDAGVQYRFLNDKLTLGAGVQNASGQLKYISEGDPLPRVIYGGAALRASAGAGELLLAADVQKPRDQKAADGRLGAEYTLSRFALRVGAKRVYNVNSMTLGGGIKLRWLSVDYGFEPAGKLDQPVHKFTVNILFGGGAGKKEAADPLPAPAAAL